MAEGLPWSVKGIDPDIRTEALHAAHASGLTLGQWLNGVIRDTVVDLKAAGSAAKAPLPSNSHSAERQDRAGSPMTHYLAQQHPYAANPYPSPPPPYAMPAPPPYPYAPPPQYMPYPPMPHMAMPDPVEQRLRAYAAGDTAVGSLPGADKLLKVIDAAVRSSEQKTAAAIEALATLMDRQRKADAESQARQAALQAAHAQQAAAAAQLRQRAASDAQSVQLQAMSEIETARAELQATQARSVLDQSGATAEVTQLLSKMAERLEGLEKSFASVRDARAGEQMREARAAEERIGDALDTLSQDREAQDFSAQDLSAQGNPSADEPGRPAVRPPPRAHARTRITVPRSSAAVHEIAARQRALDIEQAEPRTTPEAAALDAIRRSIAALADQVRDTARNREGGRATDLHLRDELKDLQRSVQDLAPRRIVGAVNESIRALAQRIEQSRQEGVRESHLAPIESLLNEMRVSLMELREPRGLETVNATLAQLADKVENLTTRASDTPQIDGLREEIVGLRAFVAEARQSQPLETVRQQIAALTDKLDALSERPRDTKVISLLTDAVDDVRRSLRKMDPEAMFTRLERRLDGIEGLERRIDALSRHIETLPSGGSAPAFDVGGLTDRIDALSQRLDTSRPVAGSIDLGDLTGRIDEMTRALQQRQEEADLSPLIRRMDLIQETIEQRGAGPEVKTLEAILRRLADRMEDVRNSSTSATSLDDLQSQIMQLAERLDRSPQADFGGLEKTLGDLVSKVSAFPDAAAQVAQSTARTMARDNAGGDPLAAEGMMLIKRDLSEMKSAQAEAVENSRDLMRQVNTTLETIASRLAKLETDTPRQRVAPPQVQVSSQATSAAAPPLSASMSAPVAQASGTQASGTQASQRPLAPTLPPGAQRALAEAAAKRPPARPPVAAGMQADDQAPLSRPVPSQSRTGHANTDSLDLPLEPGAGGTAAAGLSDSDPKSAFIAAARRAASAAAAQSAAAVAEMEQPARASFGGAALENARSTLAARRKPILLGLAAVVVVLGGLKVATDMIGSESGDTVRQASAPATPAAPRPLEMAASQTIIAPGTPSAGETEKVAVTPPVIAPSQPMPPVAANQFGAPTRIVTAPPPAATEAPRKPLETTPSAGESEAAKGLDALAAATSGLSDKLKQSALAGNPSAAYEIGARLAEGRSGMTRDVAKASQWLELAAARGFAPAQYRLGSFHREGLGVTKDPKAAMTWFKKAADQGNISAMHNLGVLYSEGVVSGQPDYANAAQWFRTAADHGVKDSQFNIAILYTRGLGVAQDLVEAYKYFAMAAKQGDQDAVKKRDALFGQIPADKQPTALKAAETAQPQKPDVRANEIIIPDGGWDGPRLPTLAVPQKKAPGKTV